MEAEKLPKLSHKEWRKIAKKERRRRIRQKKAKERDAEEDNLRTILERSANYLEWVSEQEKLREEEEKLDEELRKREEELWLEREEKSQKEWKELQERKAKARKEQQKQEELIRKEFEAKQEEIRLKKEEMKRQHEEAVRRQETMQNEINDFIDNDGEIPEVLKMISDSQPGKELCPFFCKTGSCKYGTSCSRNHRKNALTNIILIPGFYSHFSLEKNSAEYDTDIGLEFDYNETRNHYKEFYNDILPELKSFGKIVTLKTCCNSEIHLRGNVYIEYSSEREAARAWRGLKGRWYAGRQLNCEFINFKSWRNAVCGLTKCPKGRACNFLHTFRNPNNEFDIQSPSRRSRKSENSSRRSSKDFEESSRSHSNDHRNWRWSESPEMNLKHSECVSESDKPLKSSKSLSKRSKDSSRRRKSRSSRDSEDRKYLETNKENGRDRKYRKKSSRDRCRDKSDRKRRSKRSISSSSTDESFNSTPRNRLKCNNDWDTTDSEEENYKRTRKDS